MRRLIIQRLLALVPILFGITFLSFALMHLAGGDAVLARVDASGVQLSAEALAAERARLGLDKPFFMQYLIWLEGFLRGDLGVSYVSGEDVFATFLSKLPATLLLAAMSMLLTLVISIPLGILAAVRQNRATDFIIRAASFVGNSLPNFFVALVLMMLFSIHIPLFPVIAEGTSLASAVLPTLTLAIAMSSRYLRQVRAALSTIVTLLALSCGSLLGGTAVVETIFMWDGVGKLAVDAVSMRDYPIIQAYVVWMALIYVLINLLTDLLQPIIDPRLREGGAGDER